MTFTSAPAVFSAAASMLANWNDPFSQTALGHKNSNLSGVFQRSISRAKLVSSSWWSSGFWVSQEVTSRLNVPSRCHRDVLAPTLHPPHTPRMMPDDVCSEITEVTSGHCRDPWSMPVDIDYRWIQTGGHFCQDVFKLAPVFSQSWLLCCTILWIKGFVRSNFCRTLSFTVF